MRALCQSETGAKEPISFETSVIKPIAEGTPISMSGCLGGPGSNDPGRVNCEYVTLRMLLMRAYQLKAPELIGPGWLDTVYFNITATVPKGATKDQAPAMFQSLLADRFKVVIHRETKQLAGYSITVGKSGLKAKPPGPVSAANGGEASGGPPKVGADGFPILRRAITAGGPIILYRQGRARLLASEGTMAQLAEALSRQLKSIVMDETGLDGKYDLTLSWKLDDSESGVNLRTAGAASSTESAEPEPNIFMAMDQQLGLRLTKKQLARQVVVVDRAERTPTEN
jgi:uncharacterized protein (TIGR03435 family)